MDEDNDMLVINLFGGPGAGKSTTGHGLMYYLKREGHRVEFAAEYAKDLTFDKNWLALKDQIGVVEEQKRRVDRFIGMADIAINEAPFLNGIVYTPEDHPISEQEYYLSAWHEYTNLNFLIYRGNIPYQQAGRYQDEAGAHAVDSKIAKMLDEHKVEFFAVESHTAVSQIMQHIQNYLESSLHSLDNDSLDKNKVI